MTNHIKQRPLRYGFAAIVLGGGIATFVPLFSEDSSPEGAVPSHNAVTAKQKHSQNLDPLAPITPQNALSPAAQNPPNQQNLRQSWLPTHTKDVECQILANTTFKSSYLRHALNIGAQQTDSSLQMDYVRWAFSSYTDKNGYLTPEGMTQAEKETGIPVSQLIYIIQDVTRRYYEQHRTPITNTNYGMLSYWRDLALSYSLAGTDVSGQFNPALALALTSYDLATIKANRDKYLYGAAMEILNTTVKQMDDLLSINQTNDSNYQSRKNILRTLRERISVIPDDILMDLDARVSVLEYITRGPAGDGIPMPSHIREEVYNMNSMLNEELVRRMADHAEKAEKKRAEYLGCPPTLPSAPTSR